MWVGKNGVLENNGNISEMRKDRGKVSMGANKNLPTLFRTVGAYHPRPLPPPLPQDWGSQLPPHQNFDLKFRADTC